MHKNSFNRSTDPIKILCCFVLFLYGMMPAALIAATPLVLTPTEQNYLQQHPTLQLGVDPSWPPFEYFDEQGVYRGMAADYMRLVAQQLGITLQPLAGLTWSEVMQRARKGELDFLPAVMHSEQRAQFLYFTSPYLEFPMVILVRDDAPFTGGLDTLQEKRVAVVHSYVTHDLLVKYHPNLKLHLMETLDDALQSLSTGVIDAYVGNLAAISHAINTLGLSNFRVAGITPYSFPLSIAVPKTGQPLLPILEKALAAVTPEERLAIRQKWISLQLNTGIKLQSILLIALPLIAIVITFLFVSSLKNKQLRQEVKARRKSEEKYSSLFETAHDAIILMQGSTIIGCNPPAEVIFSCASKDMVGHLFADYAPKHQEDGQGSVGKLNIILSKALSGRPQRFDWRCRQKNGVDFDAEISLNTVQIEGEQYSQAIIRDTSEHLKIESILHTITTETSALTGKQFFKTLTQQLASTLGVHYALVGELVDTDPATIKTIAVWSGDTLVPNFTYPLADTPCDNVFGKVLCLYASNTQKRFPKDVMLNELGVESYAGVPLFDSRNEPFGLLVILDKKPLNERWVTRSVIAHLAIRSGAELERMRMDIKLKQAATIFENSNEGFIITDANNKIMAVNRAFFEITGYREIDILGKNPGYLQSGNHDHPFYAAMWSAINRTGCWQGEIWNKKKDGTLYPEWLMIRAIKSEEGKITNYIGVFSDISERLNAEQQQRDLQQQLHHTQKMGSLGHLTSGIAHDFNNLLNIISGYTDLVRYTGGNQSKEALLASMEQISQATDRATQLISQMLAFSREEQPDSLPIELAPLIKEEIKMIRATLPSSIEITSTIEEKLPSVLMNPTQLQQIMMNLAINARDAMDGQGTLDIRLQWCKAMKGQHSVVHEPVVGDWIGLRVSDTGSGIDPDVIGNIFNPFFTTKAAGKGTGMGLSVIFGIMKHHGGHILVDTHLKKGTIFQMLFPPLFVAVSTKTLSQASVTELPRGNGEHILVVDDEEAIGNLLQLLLNNYGYQSTIIQDSTQALSCFTADPDKFALLITDQTMPKLSGLELIEQLRLLRPQLPVILCSGFSNKITANDAEEKNINYFNKPIDSDALILRLAVLLA